MYNEFGKKNIYKGKMTLYDKNIIQSEKNTDWYDFINIFDLF